MTLNSAMIMRHSNSKTIYSVPTSNTIKDCFHIVFLFHSFLELIVVVLIKYNIKEIDKSAEKMSEREKKSKNLNRVKPRKVWYKHTILVFFLSNFIVLNVNTKLK